MIYWNKLLRYFTWLACTLSAGALAQGATLTLQTNRLGAAPELVAYNLGHFVPGSNTRDWWHYSGVQGARVFISPDIIEPGDDIPGHGDGVTNAAAFIDRCAALRADPFDTRYINWPFFTNNFAATREHGANTLSVDYACGSLQQLGVKILVTIQAAPDIFPLTDANDWAGKWELWQHFYAEAFYLGSKYGIERFQMYNEPDQGSVTRADFLQRLQITSDAVQSAIADVNRLYGKSLEGRMLAPVTVGTPSADYTAWGRMIITNRHINMFGESNVNFALIGQYDYHEYNSTPANYGSHLASLNSLLTADMVPEIRYPTSISEFNVHNASTYDGLTNTLDSPGDYTRFGGIVTALANNNCNEMYCFKFSQTLFSATVPVKKNGMHYVDNINPPYNIGGITQAGEVYRLFSTAALGKDRLGITQGSGTSGLDQLSTYDVVGKCYRLFLANPAANIDLTVNLSACNLPIGQTVMLQEISENCHGGVRALLTLTNNQVLPGLLAANTVDLLSIPTLAQAPVETISTTADAMVQDGANQGLNYGSNSVGLVKNNSTNAAGRSVVLLKFHLPTVYLPDIQFAILKVRAASLSGGNVQAHVYGITNNNWSEDSVVWSNAPNLAPGIAAGINYTNNVVVGAGDSAFMAGQLMAGTQFADQMIEVTDFVRSSASLDVSFLLTREVRFYGDVSDDNGMTIVCREDDPDNAPKLILVRRLDSDHDGISDYAETIVFGTDPHNPDTDGDGVSDGEEVLVTHTDPAQTPPRITSQPAGIIVGVGGTAIFMVGASGAGPLAYQWQLNETNNLPAATNATFTLANVQMSQAGSYRVLISNAWGTAVSAGASLVVTNTALTNVGNLFFYDPINYPVGTPLAGQGGWLLNSGDSPTNESGNLPIPGLALAGGNRFTWGSPSMSVRRPFTTTSQGSIYFSFALRVDDLGPSFGGTGTLAGLTFSTQSISFGAKINIRTNGMGGFNLGTSKAVGDTHGAWSPITFGVGEPIFVVGRYTFRAGGGKDDTCDLWLNPPMESFGDSFPPPATIAAVGTGGDDLDYIDRVFFRAAGPATSPNRLVVDEVRVGLDWATVAPPALPLIQANRSGGLLQLTWPTNFGSFVLERTAKLSTPVWTTVGGAQVLGTNYVLSVPPVAESSFYRLKR